MGLGIIKKFAITSNDIILICIFDKFKSIFGDLRSVIWRSFSNM